MRKLVLFSVDQATPDHEAPAGEPVGLSGGSRLTENTHLIWRDSEKKELILKEEKITTKSGDPSQTGASPAPLTASAGARGYGEVFWEGAHRGSGCKRGPWAAASVIRMGFTTIGSMAVRIHNILSRL